MISEFDRGFNWFSGQINSAPVQFCNDFDHTFFSLFSVFNSLYTFIMFSCVFLACLVSPTSVCVCTKKILNNESHSAPMATLMTHFSSEEILTKMKTGWKYFFIIFRKNTHFATFSLKSWFCEYYHLKVVWIEMILSYYTL